MGLRTPKATPSCSSSLSRPRPITTDLVGIAPVRGEINLSRIELAEARATRRTTWTFAEIFDVHGASALVEITSRDATDNVALLLPQLLTSLDGTTIADESELVGLLELNTSRLQTDFALATAVSALRTAVVQLQALHDGVSLTEALGGTPRESVELYANINRCLLSNRTPSAFASAAERAATEGFRAVKCAPFDEVQPPAMAEDILAMARPGLERVASVRAAVGPDVGVLVDCHSRFEAHTAPLVAEELAKLDVGWFEEPVQPTEDVEGLIEVATKVSMPVAGGERGYGEGFFDDLVRRGAVSVVMPDIKHCGGVVEAHDAGRAAIKAGGQVSLHSPSGPVSQLASAHVTSSIAGDLPLEHAAYEVPWRAELLLPPERIEGGHLRLPGSPGLGATLNPALVSRYGREWRA